MPEVLVADNGLFIGLAQRLARDLGECGYYFNYTSAFPHSKSTVIGEGFTGIIVVHDFWKALEGFDVIAFPDVYDADLQHELTKQRKAVWGSRDGEWLELDRWKLREEMERIGLPTAQTQRIEGVTKLRELLQDPATQDKWIKVNAFRGDFETFQHKRWEITRVWLDDLAAQLGPLQERETFFVEDHIEPAIEVGWDTYTIDGNYPEYGMVGYEIKGAGLVGVTMRYDEMPGALREINEKLRPVFAQTQYRNFFSTEVRVMEGGQNFLVDPCVSDDTEILTDKGWKLFADLDKSERVATLNPVTRVIEYHKPIAYQKRWHDGPMHRLSSSKAIIDLLVTPDHSVWASKREATAPLMSFKASELMDAGHLCIPRTGIWHGKDVPRFQLPEYHSQWVSGKYYQVEREKYEPAVDLPMDAWVEFLAWYLSDGSCHSEWSVNISQKDRKRELRDLLKRLPFNSVEVDSGFLIHSVQLASYLSQFGICAEKYVPEFLKSLSSRQINLFLNAYQDATHSDGRNRYYTTSRRMADNLQELVFKAGGVASIRLRKVAGTMMKVGQTTYKRNHDVYVISERMKQKTFWFDAKDKRTASHAVIPYKGYVYDVTVPNHIVYVRRNGKPVWTGNCARAPSPPFESLMEVFTGWGEAVIAGAYGDVVSVQPQAKFAVQIQLHSSRCATGWLPLEIPEEDMQWVKLSNAAIIGGVTYIVPFEDLTKVGAVVAIGDDLDQTITECKERAGRINSILIEYDEDALDKGKKEMEKGREFGIDLPIDQPPLQLIAGGQRG